MDKMLCEVVGDVIGGREETVQIEFSLLKVTKDFCAGAAELNAHNFDFIEAVFDYFRIDRERPHTSVPFEDALRRPNFRCEEVLVREGLLHKTIHTIL